MSELWVANLGEVEYLEALDLQERLRLARQQELIPDVLLQLEHPRIYTQGRRSDPGELSMGEAWYRAQGLEIVKVNRGGKVTYHGPGQLVGYPIVRVDDVVAYVRLLEQALVKALADQGVAARARPDDGPAFTGVWVGDRKIASIGVHVSKGVTTHGFAVNVDNDMAPFGWVVACGLPDVTMTSIAEESSQAGQLKCFRKRTAFALTQALGHRQRLVTRETLEGYAAQAVAQVAAAPADTALATVR
jgi:lipoyl(octanoyl) transferase